MVCVCGLNANGSTDQLELSVKSERTTKPGDSVADVLRCVPEPREIEVPTAWDSWLMTRSTWHCVFGWLCSKEHKEEMQYDVRLRRIKSRFVWLCCCCFWCSVSMICLQNVYMIRQREMQTTPNPGKKTRHNREHNQRCFLLLAI